MAFDRIIAPTVYRHPIDQILCSLKYAGRLQWARTAAGLIVDCVLQQDLDLPQLLLPVPMTRKAVRRRGFNQSAYIARLVGRQLKIKVGFDVVHKTRETHRQSTLSRSQRQQNIAGAFVLTRSVVGNRVAIVDDVVTSCSTVAELARVIKAAGASEVTVWACARTPVKVLNNKKAGC
ncbi:MAG: phosphoribosyltransferase family protein [Alphaproteobacteria bacterium]|nr:phosphoribosyltransferase family protein [Alphaproteobacteria bacterium]